MKMITFNKICKSNIHSVALFFPGVFCIYQKGILHVQ